MVIKEWNKNAQLLAWHTRGAAWHPLACFISQLSCHWEKDPETAIYRSRDLLWLTVPVRSDSSQLSLNRNGLMESPSRGQLLTSWLPGGREEGGAGDKRAALQVMVQGAGSSGLWQLHLQIEQSALSSTVDTSIDEHSASMAPHLLDTPSPCTILWGKFRSKPWHPSVSHNTLPYPAIGDSVYLLSVCPHPHPKWTLNIAVKTNPVIKFLKYKVFNRKLFVSSYTKLGVLF